MATDRLVGAARLAAVICALCGGSIVGMVLDSALREGEPDAAQRHLRWHAPGFRPPGAEGDPHLSHGAVPLGFRPGLDTLAPPTRQWLGGGEPL